MEKFYRDSWFGEYTPRTTGPSARQLAAIFENELSDIAKNRFPRAYEPLIVPRESYRSLLWATRRLLELQRSAVMHLAPNTDGRITALKADPADFPRFTTDEAFELRHAIDMSRADVVVGEEGPKFVEFNVGAGVGAVLEFELERRIWQEIRLGGGELPLTADSLYAQIAGLVKRTCAVLGTAPAVLLIGSLDDPAKTPRYFKTQIKLLQENNVEAEFADLRSLQAQLSTDYGDGKCLGIAQFSEREANSRGWDMSSLRTVLDENRMVLIPSQTARLVDSKKVLALLSEGLPWMSDEDREVVRRFVPWSRIAGDRQVQWGGQTYDFGHLMLERQELFVLKGSAGFSSEEVFFGANTSDRAWEELVASAVESEYYIAQEVVRPVLYPIQTFDESGHVETVLANPKISPFSAGGVATGCSMRFDPTGERIGPVTRPYGALPGCLLGAST